MTMDPEEINFRKGVTEDIQACLESTACQPILFVGTGLSKRYFGAPGWEELLGNIAKDSPAITKDFAFYKQSTTSLAEVGTVFAKLIQEWAWSEGRQDFPERYFSAETPKSAYLKYVVCQNLALLIDKNLPTDLLTHPLHAEMISLRSVRPHAIITTNYDTLLQILFPEYEPVVGQQILRSTIFSIGEIYKIHGCVTDPSGIVLTKEDYDEFSKKKKYLSAKLLTFFAEHPLLFVGYSASDENIRAILSDIDEILGAPDELIENIYLLDFESQPRPGRVQPRERLIPIADGKSVRIKTIPTQDFGWVFDAFASNQSKVQIQPKILRSLMARTYKLVRHDIPRRTVEVNYETLERVTEADDQLATLFGVSVFDDPEALNAGYPHTLSGVGHALGYPGWHGAHRLLQKIKRESSVDIKGSDNKYHLKVKTGVTDGAAVHKYSDAAIEMLSRIRDGENVRNALGL